MKPLQVTEENAPKFAEWLRTRGGLAVWVSKDLGGDAGSSVTTPVRTNNGEPVPRPGWRYGQTPDRIITDPAEVEVTIDKPVETFEIKLKTSGHRVVLTVVSDRKVRAALARAGDGSYHVFGERNDGAGRLYNALQFGCDTCTIMKQAQVTPLPLWLETKEGVLA
jgi:hypothetical protein